MKQDCTLYKREKRNQLFFKEIKLLSYFAIRYLCYDVENIFDRNEVNERFVVLEC